MEPDDNKYPKKTVKGTLAGAALTLVAAAVCVTTEGHISGRHSEQHWWREMRLHDCLGVVAATTGAMLLEAFTTQVFCDLFSTCHSCY